MIKEEIYKYLKNQNIWYEYIDHKAVYNMNELNELNLSHKEADAKNIFVCDDKKINYYLITIKGNKKIDLKKFREENKTRRLSFANEEELYTILKLTPGSVSPLGLLNDEDHKVHFFIDEYFIKTENSIIGIHPNDNTATVWLKTSDLINIIKQIGNEVTIFKTN